MLFAAITLSGNFLLHILIFSLLNFIFWTKYLNSMVTYLLEVIFTGHIEWVAYDAKFIATVRKPGDSGVNQEDSVLMLSNTYTTPLLWLSTLCKCGEYEGPTMWPPHYAFFYVLHSKHKQLWFRITCITWTETSHGKNLNIRVLKEKPVYTESHTDKNCSNLYCSKYYLCGQITMMWSTKQVNKVFQRYLASD